MKYRKDIDGIRAIAVLSVIAFHLGIRGVPGGFVGVDIFFVISGYLIGGIVLGGIIDGSFTLTTFYVRRFKRILPAFTLVVTAVSVAALFILLPSDLVTYGKSLAASVFSVANIFFWRETGYFDHSAAEKPLLHMWSLGVEEQFYAFFPLGALFLHRVKRSLVIPGLTLAALLSFVLSIYLTNAKPDAAFYLLPGRGWELLIGVILAGTSGGWLRNVLLRNIVGVAGLAAMLYSILEYKAGSAFPGWAAVPPSLGALAVIAAGRDGTNIAAKILSLKPVVFVGLISYSLYLWHWPVIVLFKYLAPALELSWVQRAIIFATVMILSTLSWLFVEQPFRKARTIPAVVFRYSAISVAAGLVVAAILVLSHGLPRRFSSSVVEVASYLDYDPAKQFREHQCFLREGDNISLLSTSGCLRLDAGRPNVLLLGNSHAAHLWSGLAQIDKRVNVLEATTSGWNCVPVIYRQDFSHGRERCAVLFNYIYNDFLPANRVDLVVMSATWEEIEMGALQQTLIELRARKIPVLLVGPATQYEMPLPRLVAWADKRNDAGLPARFEETSPLRFDERLQHMSQDEGAYFVSAHALLCGATCVTAVNGSPLLFDTDHLTPDGSALLATHLIETPAWQVMISNYERANGRKL